MSEQNDENQNYALMVLAALVLLVVGGVIAVAGYKGIARTDSAPRGPLATVVLFEPDGRVYFDSGSDALPPQASETIVKVADAARAQPGKVVLISGFHDATGSAAANAELARKRAQAVRHALEADGVAPDRLLLDKPILTTGAGDPRDARRVEMRLR